MDIKQLIASAALILDLDPLAATRMVTLGIMAHSADVAMAATAQDIPTDIALAILTDMAQGVIMAGHILASENN